jgi:hypothetical protein
MEGGSGVELAFASKARTLSSNGLDLLGSELSDSHNNGGGLKTVDSKDFEVLRRTLKMLWQWRSKRAAVAE